MAVKVVDASAAAALLFGELEADAVAARLRGRRLVAPALLGFEIAHVCVKKLRRNSMLRDTLLAVFPLLERMEIGSIDVDHAASVEVADAFGLSGYDAANLWLARELAAELVTLDSRLHAAAAVRR